mmetsp:Transcript_18000/g.58888  ORF Transcript_18000/g.58888 Transcript_18000/m.58888 type:complete len:285 (+) Transcript_18000:605-1459(+)
MGGTGARVQADLDERPAGLPVGLRLPRHPGASRVGSAVGAEPAGQDAGAGAAAGRRRPAARPVQTRSRRARRLGSGRRRPRLRDGGAGGATLAAGPGARGRDPARSGSAVRCTGHSAAAARRWPGHRFGGVRPARPAAGRDLPAQIVRDRVPFGRLRRRDAATVRLQQRRGLFFPRDAGGRATGAAHRGRGGHARGAGPGGRSGRVRALQGQREGIAQRVHRAARGQGVAAAAERRPAGERALLSPARGRVSVEVGRALDMGHGVRGGAHVAPASQHSVGSFRF